MSRAWLWLAVLSGVLLPGEAAACTPDPCADAVAFVGLELADDEVEVPVDGVVVLQANWFGALEAQAMVDGLSLTVTRAGSPVEGALEASALAGVLVWRPTEALAPGETYQMSGTFLNAADVSRECAAAEVTFALEFTAAADPAEPLAEPTFSAIPEYVDFPIGGLDALVCCDGAMPREQRVCGISHGVAWSQGHCAPALTRARLRVELRVSAGAEVPTVKQWVHTLYQDGEEIGTTLDRRFTRFLTEPACFVVERRSLATGEVFVSEEACVGEEFGEPLGEVPLDPRELLAGACAGELYTCEVGELAWDADACAPWAPPESVEAEARAGGCGCVGGVPDPGAGLLGLWLLARRRRRYRSRISATTAVVHSPRL